jgi:hypothetical protein
MIKNVHVFIPRPYEGRSPKLLYSRSLQPSKDNIQHFKTTLFFTVIFLWHAHMNPDPANQNQCGSRSTTLIKIFQKKEKNIFIFYLPGSVLRTIRICIR